MQKTRDPMEAILVECVYGKYKSSFAVFTEVVFSEDMKAGIVRVQG